MKKKGILSRITLLFEKKKPFFFEAALKYSSMLRRRQGEFITLKSGIRYFRESQSAV